jgi:hypothetical protein
MNIMVIVRHNLRGLKPEFSTFKDPSIDSKEPIPSGFVAWRAGTTTYSYSVPSPHTLFKNSSTRVADASALLFIQISSDIEKKSSNMFF